MAYCSTMALAAVVSLVAAMNRKPHSATPSAPSTLPFVTRTFALPRAKPSSTAATSERKPFCVSAFQGRNLLNTPANDQLIAASATSIAPMRLSRFMASIPPDGIVQLLRETNSTILLLAPLILKAFLFLCTVL